MGAMASKAANETHGLGQSCTEQMRLPVVIMKEREKSGMGIEYVKDVLSVWGRQI
jgi:hypothetical protein